MVETMREVVGAGPHPIIRRLSWGRILSRAAIGLTALVLVGCSAGGKGEEGLGARTSPLCAGAVDDVVRGSGVGGLEIGLLAAQVRDTCPVVGDTTLHLEGELQPGLIVELGGSPVIAEIVADRVWRIRIYTPGLQTLDSIGVGTPAREVATVPAARLLSGEGSYFVIAPEHCGLSFEIEGLPDVSRSWELAELADQSDSVRVGTILISGCPG